MLFQHLTAALALATLPSLGLADGSGEDLILADCGIGDNKAHSSWSTSRQMNWYKTIQWPDSAYDYPNAPDMAVEVPYKEGIYPWVPGGVTATMPNGDVWTAYIQDGTPDGFKAGTAVSTKDGKDTLSCWAYRGRPVSAAINHTLTEDSVCWSAFVCNHDNTPPPRPKDMGSKTSTLSTSTVAPTTTSLDAPLPTNPGGPAPTGAPDTGKLQLDAGVSPRFLNWPNTWDAFMANFAWDPATGNCVGAPVLGSGYTIMIECAGIQIDQDSHMTLLMIEALRNVGKNSLWFNQNPVVPGGSPGGNSTGTSWVVMPESFSLSATDTANNNVVGSISYQAAYQGFLTGPCSVCDTARFNSNFFDPVIAAMQGTYPEYHSFTIEAKCNPWMVC